MKQGKILKIIDDYNILVSLGSNDGVTNESIFEIYAIGPEIKDLDGISYGTFDYIKATIVPKVIYPKMTLCRNKETVTKIIRSPIFNTFSETQVEEDIPLPIDGKSIDTDIRLSEFSTIKLDDFVRLVYWEKNYWSDS